MTDANELEQTLSQTLCDSQYFKALRLKMDGPTVDDVITRMLPDVLGWHYEHSQRDYAEGYEQAYFEAELSDLSTCSYYQRSLGGDPNGICSFGCEDEPQCQTCEPQDGWPTARLQIQAMRFATTGERANGEAEA